jgi:phosphoribosylformylglycinamidine cyclo-ligase
MVSSDITRYGGVPLVLTNILDVVAVGDATDAHHHAYTELMRGLGNAARDVRGVILKGETAQMGVCIGSENVSSPSRFNWSASMLGAYHPDKMVTGDAVQEGDVVIALQERGFRSNGMSSVRAAFKKQFGDQWYKNAEALPYIQQAAAPSVLYDVYVNTLHGWYDKKFTPEVTLKAIVHISGGGVKEKFGNDLLFGRGLSATLDNLCELPDIVRTCAQWRGFSDEELYGSWNAGQGMLLVVPPQDATRAVSRAADFGIVAQVAGTITKEKTPRLVVHSKLSGKDIVFS